MFCVSLLQIFSCCTSTENKGNCSDGTESRLLEALDKRRKSRHIHPKIQASGKQHFYFMCNISPFLFSILTCDWSSTMKVLNIPQGTFRETEELTQTLPLHYTAVDLNQINMYNNFPINYASVFVCLLWDLGGREPFAAES